MKSETTHKSGCPEVESGKEVVNGKKKWFIVHVLSGYEKKLARIIKQRCIAEGLGDKIDEVVIPTKTVSKLGKKGKISVEKKLYPGYIAVCMEPEKEMLNLISRMHGVMSFAGKGRIPQILDEEESERMLGIATGAEIKDAESRFTKGTSVKVIDGPFAEFNGIIEEVIPERERVKVMVTIFGRQTPVELSFFQIEVM